MTIHNLIVVSMEKYAAHVLCLHSSQNDLFSWLSGFVVTLAPAATFTEMKYNRNETHFTVICRYNNANCIMKVVFFIFESSVCILPNIFLAFTNICLVKTVWN